MSEIELAQKYSGVIIDQNQVPDPAHHLDLDNQWYYQEFWLPEKFRYGTLAGEFRYPELSGFQILVKIPEGEAAKAALNWKLEFDVFGVGWTELEQGSVVGCHADGEQVWLDVFFRNPVHMGEVNLLGALRIGFQKLASIDSIWYAEPNPIFNVEALEEATGLGYSFDFRILALTADSGTDFLGNPYRSIVVKSSASNVDTTTGGTTTGFWRSAPQPSEFAVVSTYYDVRNPPILGELNIVQNPSVEYGISGYSQKGYWLTEDLTVPPVVTTDEAFSGSSSLLVENEGGVHQGASMTFPKNEAFIAGKPYTASVYLRGHNVTSNTEYEIRFGNGKDFAKLAEVNLSNEWQRFSLVWIPVESVVSDGSFGEKAVSVTVRTTASDTPGFYLDALMVSPTASLKPYLDGDLAGAQWTDAPGESASVEVTKNPAVIDSVFLDPQTPNVAFNVYYSNEGEGDEHTTTEEWEKKLWTRVPQSYTATGRQQYVFPEPIKASFVQIEFTNLQAQSYNPGDFPKPVAYKKFPIWVTDYFIAQMQLPNFVANVVGVSYDALEFAYNYYLDDLHQKPANPASTPSEVAEHINSFFNRSDASNLVDPETLTQINLIMNTYTAPPAIQGDSKTLLGNKQSQIALAQINYPVEATPSQIATSLINVSRLNRENIVFEKTMPVMYFFLTCRHGYKELSASFDNNRAYFAAVNEVAFMRNQYTTAFDGEMYIESGGDNVNIETNDFIINDDGIWTT
jgi:hypothetical protein